MEKKYVYESSALPRPVLPDHPEWVALYYKAWELAFQNVDYIQKPGWKPQLTCMPGVGIVWQWDSCLMAFITNYSNGTLSALNNLDNLYRLQRPSDGYMSMAYRIEEEVPAYGSRINPPLLAWAEWESYLVSGDSERLARVIPHLEGCYAYIEQTHRRNCGLYWFEDPGSSGMDNSPRGGYHAIHKDGSDLCHIDLACQQALSAKCIANILQVLGDAEKAAYYLQEHTRICQLINGRHWSEKVGFYFDFFIRTRPESKVKFLNSKTIAAGWALVSDAAQGERRERLIKHFYDPQEFYTPVPFASLSRDDPNYDSNGGYWLGSVWAPTNFAVIRGVAESGREELAREAAIRYLDAICRVERDPAYGSIWECYAPEAIRPATAEEGELVRSDFVGWSGIAPITMLIENIIGLRFNAKENQIIFRLTPGQLGGLENMCFNGGKVSLVCTDYVPVDGGSILKINAEKPFTLVVRNNCSGYDKTFRIQPGIHQISV